MRIRYTIRQYSRFRTPCPVYYLGLGFLGKGHARDLSIRGGRIDGDRGVGVGMILTMAVFLPGEPKAITLEKAVVRWAQDGSFGVRILVMNMDESVRLARFVVSCFRDGPNNIDV